MPPRHGEHVPHPGEGQAALPSAPHEITHPCSKRPTSGSGGGKKGYGRWETVRLAYSVYAARPTRRKSSSWKGKGNPVTVSTIRCSKVQISPACFQAASSHSWVPLPGQTELVCTSGCSWHAGAELHHGVTQAVGNQMLPKCVKERSRNRNLALYCLPHPKHFGNPSVLSSRRAPMPPSVAAQGSCHHRGFLPPHPRHLCRTSVPRHRG